MKFRTATAVLALSLVGAATLEEQNRTGPEFTAGAGAIGHETYDGDDSYTWFSFPESFLRVAFFLSPRVAIEPDVSFYWWSGEGDSGSQIRLGAFVPFYFNGDRGATGFYAAPGIGVTLYSEEDEDGTSQMFYAAEVGKKFRLNDSVMLRGALQYFHEPENDDYFSYSNLGLILGISFFVK